LFNAGFPQFLMVLDIDYTSMRLSERDIINAMVLSLSSGDLEELGSKSDQWMNREMDLVKALQQLVTKKNIKPIREKYFRGNKGTSSPTATTFQQLADYPIIRAIMGPRSMIHTENTNIKTCSFTFHLKLEDLNKISHGRDLTALTANSKFPVQVQLRMGLDNPTTEQEDRFPPLLMIKVNNKQVILKNLQSLGRGRLASSQPEFSRMSGPVDITQLCFLRPDSINQIEITWTPQTAATRYIFNFFCNFLSKNNLLFNYLRYALKLDLVSASSTASAPLLVVKSDPNGPPSLQAGSRRKRSAPKNLETYFDLVSSCSDSDSDEPSALPPSKRTRRSTV